MAACKTTVIVGNPTASVTIRPAQNNVVTLNAATAAAIQARRTAIEVADRRTAVTVADRAPRMSAGGNIGQQGPPGADGDKHYRHTQATPSATWVVVHGLNKYPTVAVIDSGGETVYGDVEYDSLTQCTIRFAGAFSGEAFCN